MEKLKKFFTRGCGSWSKKDICHGCALSLPLKDAATYESLHFSEWLESMRKDMECTFGILKSRFSILKYGIRLRSLNQCDNVWLACCALHNMLLKIDGYDKNWTSGECHPDNENNDSTNNQSSQTPFAVSRLNDNLSG